MNVMKQTLLLRSSYAPERLSQALRCSLLLALLLGAAWPALNAQCTYTRGSSGYLSQSYTQPAPMDPAVSYSTSFGVTPTLVASSFVATDDMEITLCYYGDMNDADERWDVRISGQTFANQGAFGSTTSAGSPRCIDYTVSAANVSNDLSDGDIDIQYLNFEAGWLTGDAFNARIDEARFEYDLDLSVASISDRCQDGADFNVTGTPFINPLDAIFAGIAVGYSITPNPGSGVFDIVTGAFDVSDADPGSYNANYRVSYGDCFFSVSEPFEIFRAPRASLKNTDIDCVAEGGTVDLGILYDGAITGGGDFSIVSGPSATIDGNQMTVPPGGGTFTIRYLAPNDNGCADPPYQDEATLNISIGPDPEITISGATSPLCTSNTTFSINVGRNSSGPNPVVTIDNGTTVMTGNLGSNTLAAPVGAGSITYEICLEESNATCDATDCEIFTVYNDGLDCGANAPFSSQCPPDEGLHDPCVINTQPGLLIGCSLISLETPPLLGAEVDPVNGVIQCSDESVEVDWQGSLGGAIGDAVTGGPTLGSINDAAEVVCDVITYEFCVDVGFAEPCFDPLPLGSFEDACDQTIGQFVFGLLGDVIGGPEAGGGGIIVADTDGDGAFDYLAEEYEFPDNGRVTIPNNITTKSGTITVRNVVGFPLFPESACGVVHADDINLIDLLPIGFIPVVGPIIEQALASAQCGVNLLFSDEETREIQVINTTPPTFASCNESGYVFTEDLACTTEANWSIPQVYDGCNGEVLPFIGVTNGVDLTFFNGTAPAPIVPNGPGVYQTTGPLPGSELPAGTYEVTYTAYSCAGVESSCTFPVVVEPGDPVLECPPDLVLKNDVDQCSAIITGLAPVKGVGCASVINYAIDYPDGTGFIDVVTNTLYSEANQGTFNDASGEEFPVGVSTVTYTMMVDINGDGDILDMNEMQTCSFLVEILDAQRPVAECQDVEVQLDNTGNVTVFAMDPFTGESYINAGSFDNCDPSPEILIAKADQVFGPSVFFDCTEVGANYVNLRVTDEFGNRSNCLAEVTVRDFFDGVQLSFDAPEICFEANNPSQLDFRNYLTITLPNGSVLTHDQVENSPFFGDGVGAFGITAFAPAAGSSSVDPGVISSDGIYEPGEGTGFVTVSYALALPGLDIPQNGNFALANCLEIVHETFELRQPLDMPEPDCECIVQNERIVDLGTVTGGLEPYTIQYDGGQIDVNNDGIIDDVDGEFIYDPGRGFDINDFEQDLGELHIVYTQPTWSIAVVDARGCEIFRSGSCDNDDDTEGPELLCTGAADLFTEPLNCESQYSWDHVLPTDNCDVILYTYTITNPDGSIEGPFDLTTLLNPDITEPIPSQFTGEYEFQLGTTTVSYYVEDAVGNFDECSFEVTVSDDDAPYFTNCPEPVVEVETQEDLCQGFANFALPVADDNCDIPTVTQIDDTGLTPGDLFPIGTTVLTYRAEDLAGNFTDCSVTVIVHDLEDPEILCQDITVPVGASCDYLLTPDRLDAGTTDNCTTGSGTIMLAISLDNQNYVDEIEFGLDDLINSPVTVYMQATDEAGNSSFCTAEVNLVDETAPTIICPEDRIIYAEQNFCAGKVPNLAAELTIDNCAPIDTVYQVPSPNTLFGTHHGDSLYVVLTVVDIEGNTDTCAVELTLQDTISPVFVNCPEPAVIVDAPDTWCSAYANFSLPLAEDNCAVASVTQIDDTGLTSGDLFPVGITVMTWEAVDNAGNSSRCDVKVVVNDYHTPPTITCTGDVTTNNDPGDAGAIVENIAPAGVTDNCGDNLTVIYRIQDETGEVVNSGFDDASGTFFDLGTYTVSYAVQDMPLLLITEVTHDISDPVAGTLPLPAAVSNPTGDYVEIANFNSADLDVSQLQIERIHNGGRDTLVVPTGVVLEPGGVLAVHFGNGTDDVANRIFNVPGASDLSTTTGAAYVVSLSGAILDAAVFGNFSTAATLPFADWSGFVPGNGSGIVRTSVWDTNTAADFTYGEQCMPTSIGQPNPFLATPVPNGTQTAIQAQSTVRVECGFDVTVNDNEFPLFGLYSEPYIYTGSDMLLEAGECMTSTIDITDSYTIADVNLIFQGEIPEFGNLSLTLISPSGQEIVLADAICGATAGAQFTFDSDIDNILPYFCIRLNSNENLNALGDLDLLSGRDVQGTWTLQAGHNAELSDNPILINGWRLSIQEWLTYDPQGNSNTFSSAPVAASALANQEDVTLNAGTGLCQAPFAWVHPVMFDNGPEGGSLSMVIENEDGDVLTTQSLDPGAPVNEEVSFNFPLGVSTVIYTLTDESGNVSENIFTVQINDLEAPELICPDDVVVELGPTECEGRAFPNPQIDEDNCGVVFFTYDPPLNALLPIGETVVTITASDATGNETSCTYTQTIVEYTPTHPELTCNDTINVSLGPDCEALITADMLLEGNDYRCYDNYNITLIPQNPSYNGQALPEPVIPLDLAGEYIIAEICDASTGECCWGIVRAEFKEEPEFICPADATVLCSDDVSPAALGEPEVTSCVPGGVTIAYTDEFMDNGECASPRVNINRTWTVTDGQGNSASCLQSIVVQELQLDQVVFPPDYDGVDEAPLSCQAVAADPSLLLPDSLGYPTLDGTTNILDNSFCSAAVFYEDEVYETCEGNSLILRTWKVRNYCLPTSEPAVEHVQTIRITDFTGPEILCPEDQVISTSPFGCSAFLTLPEPNLVEGCAEATYRVSVSGGALSLQPDGTYLLSNLSVGVYVVDYHVTDACGRRTDCSITVTVEDQIDPAAICNDQLNVTVGGGGYGRVFAHDVDEGSWDGCGLESISVRRQYNIDSVTCSPLATPYFSAWGDYIDFNCCDVNDSIKVELHVTDVHGNENLCWITVVPEDKIAPYCEAPDNLVVDCDDLPYGFDAADADQLEELFGGPTATDNCGVEAVQQIASNADLECGFGSITRIFRATDIHGLSSTNSCVQSITINEVHNYEIKFPADAESNCGTATPDTVSYNELACDLLAVTHKDEFFSASGDECYKIFRTWKVINWCQYDGESDPHLVGRDEDCNGTPGDAHVWLLARPNGKIYFDEDTDETPDNNVPGVNLCGVSDDYYSFEYDETGYYQYTQIIKVYDDQAPVISFGTADPFCSLDSEDCGATVTYGFTVAEDCTPDALSITVAIDAFNNGSFEVLTDALSGAYPNYTIEGVFPIGDHTFEVVVEDGCGNSDLVTIPFTVEDCKALAPICLNGIAVELMPVDLDGDNLPDPGQGMAEIWASDYVNVASQSPDCSEPIKYSINRVGEPNDPDQTGLVLTCDDAGTLVIEIWAYDAAGNGDFCETYILVQDNMSVCGDATPSIAGLIHTEDDDPVEGVMVGLSGGTGADFMTENDGTYSFYDIQPGLDYTVTPQLDTDPLNGVSTFDLLMISRHILGISPVDGPYKRIAADVNQSGSITTLDMIQLRKMILGVQIGFSNNTSWRFVEADYVFANPLEPWDEAFPELVNLNDLPATGINGLDFVAVKVGDVTGDAVANSFSSIESRNYSHSFVLHTPEQEVLPGQTVEIPFRVNDAVRLLGHQFTLKFEGLQLEQIEYAAMQEGHFGLAHLDQGLLTGSWNMETEGLNEGDLLFTLRAKAMQGGLLSELLSLNSEVTRTEAYDLLSGTSGLVLGFVQPQDMAQPFALYQNEPNPFRESTVVRYTVPKDGPVTFVLRDAAGRLLLQETQDAAAGDNFWTVSKAKLPSGLIYYTIETAFGTDTKRMLLTE